MGIYVQSVADLPSDSSPLQFSTSLKRCAERWATDRGLGSLFMAGEASESGVWICFYPPEDGIQFQIGGGRVSFEAKTSVAGPGYHAALIDLCDLLQAELGIKWRWDGERDETGFALRRDMDELRTAFVALFAALCDCVKTRRPSDGRLVINLAWGLAIDDGNGIATPVGLLPPRFFLDALVEPGGLSVAAARFFPWWNAPLDDAFWAKTLRTTLWAEVEWRPPQTPWEAHVQKSVFIIFRERMGTKLDGELKAALLSLAGLVSGDAKPEATAPADIGWRRRRREFRLPGPWRIALPGHFIEEPEDDGATTCLWFGSEEIRGSSFATTFESESQIEWDAALRDSVDHVVKGGGPCVYRLPLVPRALREPEGFFVAQAHFRARNKANRFHLLVLSVFDSNPRIIERLSEIAKEVWFQPPADAVKDSGVS